MEEFGEEYFNRISTSEVYEFSDCKGKLSNYLNGSLKNKRSLIILIFKIQRKEREVAIRWDRGREGGREGARKKGEIPNDVTDVKYTFCFNCVGKTVVI